MSSNKKEIERAIEVSKALNEAKQEKKASKNSEKSSKKSSKNAEKIAKKSSEYSRPLHQDGQFGGPGAQARARQRHFDTSGQSIVRHPGVDPTFASMPDRPVGEDEDGAVS